MAAASSSLALDPQHQVIKESEDAAGIHPLPGRTIPLPDQVHFKLTQNDLMYVLVDKEMLRAAIQFWDPDFRIFVFGEVDMTPTLEEYDALLRIPNPSPNKIYKHEAAHGFKRKLAKILGVQAHTLDKMSKSKGGSEGIPWFVLKKFILQAPESEVDFKAFALAVYGLVIFPKALGYVDGRAIILFEQILYNSNPIPSILAETFRSLSICKINGQGRFRGCAQLLTIWMKSHFECVSSAFQDPYIGNGFPIAEFVQSTWPPQMAKTIWVEKLQSLTERDVVWLAPWMERYPMLYRCGGYTWVPLLGLWEATAYAPTLARRQLGSMQFIPDTHQLSAFEFPYGKQGMARLIAEVCEAWKQTRRVTPGAYTDNTTPNYFSWRMNRITHLQFPDPMDQDIFSGEWGEDLLIDPEHIQGYLTEESQGENQPHLTREAVL